MFAAFSVMKIQITFAVKIAEPLIFIFDGMRMNKVDDDFQPVTVCRIHKFFEFLRIAEARSY